MLINLVKILFSIFGAIFVILFSIRAFGKFNDPGKLSAFVSGIGMSLVLYLFFAIILVLLFPDILSKIIMVLFCLSPFIIGKLASYKKLRLYSIIQILCVILSVAFVILM